MDLLIGLGIGMLLVGVVIFCIYFYKNAKKQGIQKGYTVKEAEQFAIECLSGVVVLVLFVWYLISKCF